jgi:thiol:disulfide interchange protein
MGDILTGFMVLLILLGISSPIIVVGVIYYLKKRLEHKQIMAAIEKGTPLSEIIPPKPKPAGPAWIKYVSIGIALLIIAVGLIFIGSIDLGPRGVTRLIVFILLGIGVAWLIRGLLHRKYYLKNQAENNTAENKKSA